MPDRLISPLTRLQIGIPSAQPLDLSLKTLEEKIIQEFKTQAPIEQICKKLESNIYRIYKTIKKHPIPIKIDRRYNPVIKHRIQEAQNLGITIEKIAEIFDLEKHKIIYIDRRNRSVLMKQLAYNRIMEQSASFIQSIPENSQVIHRLKKPLHEKTLC